MAKRNPDISKAIKEVVKIDMLSRMQVYAQYLIQHASIMKEYLGFTGNTQTSYSVGVFYDNDIKSIHNPSNAGVEKRRPLRPKINYDESVYLTHPFESPNNGRRRNGYVVTNNMSGVQTSYENIRDFHPNSAFAMFVTTGTEYSEMLEQEYDLNVLSVTYDFSNYILRQAFESIRKL